VSNLQVHLVLLDDLPCPGSHYLHTKKFLSGFENHGFTYNEIRLQSDLDKINQGDIVYISNHGLEDGSIPTATLEILSSKNSYFILWYWHKFIGIASQFFGDRWVLTGEHFHRKPILEGHVAAWEVQQSIQNYVPLTFASGLKPEQVGTFQRNEKYLAHFIGAGYKQKWNKKLTRDFDNILCLNTPPFIAEELRQEIFLSSGVGLGWHSDGNIENNVVVERVFEGLAFGNFVVSDTPMARELTDGIVEFVQDYDDLKFYISKFKKDSSFRTLKSEKGLNWAKNFGTYSHVANNFIRQIKQID